VGEEFMVVASCSGPIREFLKGIGGAGRDEDTTMVGRLHFFPESRQHSLRVKRIERPWALTTALTFYLVVLPGSVGEDKDELNSFALISDGLQE
jgi:hypothetical protein